ncbi:hypothetical protein BY458DRAFT_495331 [Sporodiniella umbellata]|nr:hypothetical protein BY458DRAFT_495331 [Sporodiniella umbellata]
MENQAQSLASLTIVARLDYQYNKIDIGFSNNHRTLQVRQQSYSFRRAESLRSISLSISNSVFGSCGTVNSIVEKLAFLSIEDENLFGIARYGLGFISGRFIAEKGLALRTIMSNTRQSKSDTVVRSREGLEIDSFQCTYTPPLQSLDFQISLLSQYYISYLQIQLKQIPMANS